MKPRLIRDLTILLLIFGAIWAFVTVVFKDQENTKVLSIEKEEQIGEYMIESLSKDQQFRVIKSNYADSVISVLMDRLLDSLVTEYNFKILLFENPMINAFAMPGGYIMVSSGLVNMVDKPEELASVVAHEMGHIQLKHILTKLIKELGLSILLSNDAFIIGEVSRAAASTAFDRRKEAAADKFALELLEKSRIDPRILGMLFRKMKENDLNYDKRFEMMMTHPHNDSRIKMALEYKLPEEFESLPLEINWSVFKDSISNAPNATYEVY